MLRIPQRRAVVVALAGGLALASLLGAPGRLTAQTVPEEFHGDWMGAAASRCACA